MRNKFGGKPEIENRASGKPKCKDSVIDPKNSRTSMFLKVREENKAAQLKSVTEVTNLQEFMDTMKMRCALDDERKAQDVERVVVADINESVATAEQRNKQALAVTESFNYENLPIPRKPKWDSNTTTEQLKAAEEETFLNWRRRLAQTAKESNLEMTPFEKNLYVWKQLWRVVERAHLLILIVDARNPLAFISRDLFKYVHEVHESKRCLLMINKADYLTPLQREYWRQYFQSLQIEVVYFSAMREEMRLNLTTKSNRDQLTDDQKELILENTDCADSDDSDLLSVQGLMSLFS